MRLTRVYVDAALAAGATVQLSASATSHLTRVLRLRAGAELIVFNGQGGEYPARIGPLRPAAATVVLGEHRPLERESPLAVTLAQGISRGERMDLVVQKATELGVAALVPLFTARSVVRLDARQMQRRLEHWRAIAIGACEQSGRNRIPLLHAPQTLPEFLRAGTGGSEAAAAARAAAPLRLLLSPTAQARIDQLGTATRAVTVLIGPEGGLAEAETAAASNAGYVPVQLGPRVLRTETAAIAALTLLQREFGDLR